VWLLLLDSGVAVLVVVVVPEFGRLLLCAQNSGVFKVRGLFRHCCVCGIVNTGRAVVVLSQVLEVLEGLGGYVRSFVLGGLLLRHTLSCRYCFFFF
jgi:hypothetical protein